MPETNDKLTIASMAVVGEALAPLVHEGLGHGVVAWLRGAGPLELTSNHLSTLRADRCVEAAGTIANLVVGTAALLLSRRLGSRANARYFLWLFAALNLLPAAGYFLFSGVFGVGDWHAIIAGLRYEVILRIAMSVLGLVLTVLVVKQLAKAVRPFVPERRTYNVVGKLPYLVSCLFYCAAGLLDPLGLKLLFLSTIPAAFGGLSGLVWADSFIPSGSAEPTLVVRRAPAWWIAAILVGGAFIAILGPGIKFAHPPSGPSS